jgi:hypothetical protein
VEVFKCPLFLIFFQEHLEPETDSEKGSPEERPTVSSQLTDTEKRTMKGMEMRRRVKGTARSLPGAPAEPSKDVAERVKRNLFSFFLLFLFYFFLYLFFV